MEKVNYVMSSGSSVVEPLCELLFWEPIHFHFSLAEKCQKKSLLLTAEILTASGVEVANYE